MNYCWCMCEGIYFLLERNPLCEDESARIGRNEEEVVISQSIWYLHSWRIGIRCLSIVSIELHWLHLEWDWDRRLEQLWTPQVWVIMMGELGLSNSRSQVRKVCNESTRVEDGKKIIDGWNYRTKIMTCLVVWSNFQGRSIFALQKYRMYPWVPSNEGAQFPGRRNLKNIYR